MFVLTLPDNINGRIAMPGLRYMLAVASGAMLLAGNAFAADPFTLSSSSFKDGTLLPKKMGKKHSFARGSTPQLVVMGIWTRLWATEP